MKLGRIVTALLILIAPAALAPRVYGQFPALDFEISLPHLVINGTYELAADEFVLSPTAGYPNLGEPMTAGEFSLLPAPVFPILPASAPFLDLSRAHAYPVPFRPSLGHDRITFAGLTRSAAVTIYTLTGERVRSLGKDDATAAMEWRPVNNERGERVASGLYLFLLRNPLTGERKTGKIIIIR